jgi:ABC-type phosphate/phosphonate transport system ATPase subunit
MPTANKDAQSSGDLLVRQGALSAEQIRALCPQFRILIIGKANAGKTTILRKVCNAKPDAKPTVYDAKGKEVKVRLEKSQSWQKETNQKPGIIMIVTAVLAVQGFSTDKGTFCRCPQPFY